MTKKFIGLWNVHKELQDGSPEAIQKVSKKIADEVNTKISEQKYDDMTSFIFDVYYRDAIFFATEVHAGQVRKGKDVSYITHPLTVALILSQARAPKEVVLAGILHDTIEDCEPYGSITKETIANRFSPEVAELVDAVTEKDKGLSWHERKERALEEVKNFSKGALLVKSADVISNNTELIKDYESDGDSTFDRFNASKIEIITHTLQLIRVIIESWEENPIKGNLSLIASRLQSIGAGQFMSDSPAPIIEYSDFTDEMQVKCPICGWKGVASKYTEYYDGLMDVDCPICDKKLLIVAYPKA